MNITIHRGANQIGGCITEISSDNCKLLIDFGSNLPGNQKAEFLYHRDHSGRKGVRHGARLGGSFQLFAGV